MHRPPLPDPFAVRVPDPRQAGHHDHGDDVGRQRAEAQVVPVPRVGERHSGAQRPRPAVDDLKYHVHGAEADGEQRDGAVRELGAQPGDRAQPPARRHHSEQHRRRQQR